MEKGCPWGPLVTQVFWSKTLGVVGELAKHRKGEKGCKPIVSPTPGGAEQNICSLSTDCYQEF